MKDEPYPLEDDRSQEFEESGAELLLEYGRSINDTYHGCQSIEALFEEKEQSEEPRKEMYRVQSKLFDFFKDHQYLPLRRHLCPPGDGRQIDIRIASILAYVSVCLVDSGHVCLPIFAVSAAVADVLPMKTPILEVRRIIAALAAKGVLEVDGGSKLNPRICLGDPFVVDFFGKHCHPQLAEVAAQPHPAPQRDHGVSGAGVPVEEAEHEKLPQDSGEDKSGEERE
jgi:hypothetical protein